MAKKKVKQEKVVNNNETAAKLPIQEVLFKHATLINIAIVVLLIGIVFFPLAFQGYRPGGVDVIGNQGAQNLVKEWQKQSHEKALWNPTVFSGMPLYYSIKSVWHLELLFSYMGFILYTPILYYIMGAIGFILLFRYLKFSHAVCLFGAISFVFTIHWANLLEIGHFMKFKPIMLLPLILYLFLKLMRNPNLFNMALFALIQTWQIRTQHYQIIFYTAVMLFFVMIAELIRNKNLRGKSMVFLLIAAVLIIGVSYQMLALISEYTPYSIRGGTGEENSTGVSIDYATGWSFHPSEVMGMIIPRYHGGTSQEFYDVSNPSLPQLKDRAVPGYWGHMPFTQTSEYMGAIVFILALIGVILNIRSRLVISFLTFAFFAFLLSMGRHFPALYNLFFNYVPAFNKFRVPAMIVVMINFSILLFAGFGLQSLLFHEDRKKVAKTVYIVSAIVVLIGIFTFIQSGAFEYSTAREASQYDQQNIKIFKTIRKDMLTSDTVRYLVFSIIGLLSMIAFVRGMLKNKYLLAVILILVSFVDMIQIQHRYLLRKIDGEYQNISLNSEMKNTVFKKTEIDKYIINHHDKDLDFSSFRVYPLNGNIWNSNDYSFYYQSIGGYNPAKLRIYQDVRDFGVIGQMGQVPVFSRNIPNMLNAKYVIADSQLPQQAPFDKFKFVKMDRIAKKFLYENLEAPGRAWFVGDLTIAETRADRFKLLNSDKFNVLHSAILEQELQAEINIPANASIKVTHLDPNRIDYDTKNDSTSLMVLSDVHYKPGWKAFIDGKETEIYKTNHAIQSIVVPAGNHKVELKFAPAVFTHTHYLSLFALLINLALLGVGYWFNIRKKTEEVVTES